MRNSKRKEKPSKPSRLPVSNEGTFSKENDLRVEMPIKHRGVLILWVIVVLVAFAGLVAIVMNEKEMRETSNDMKEETTEFENAFRDTDSDGLSDAREEELGTDPVRRDTDGDGYTDKEETETGHDPLKSESKE